MMKYLLVLFFILSATATRSRLHPKLVNDVAQLEISAKSSVEVKAPGKINLVDLVGMTASNSQKGATDPLWGNLKYPRDGTDDQDKFSLEGHFSNGEVQAVIMKRHTTTPVYYAAFRGALVSHGVTGATNVFGNMYTMVSNAALSGFADDKDKAKCHTGLKTYTNTLLGLTSSLTDSKKDCHSKTLLKCLQDLLDGGKSLTMVGLSMGGGMASISYYTLLKWSAEKTAPVKVFNFGSLRVGNKEFTDVITKDNFKSFITCKNAKLDPLPYFPQTAGYVPLPNQKKLCANDCAAPDTNDATSKGLAAEVSGISSLIWEKMKFWKSDQFIDVFGELHTGAEYKKEAGDYVKTNCHGGLDNL